MTEIFQNIRKIYHFVSPCEELAGYVEFFAESSVELTKHYFDNQQFSVRMFASWTPTFYINLGASYIMDVGKQKHLVKSNEDVLILRNSTVERFNQPTDNIFTVKFYPGGLEAVLGLSQRRLVDQVINLATLLPQGLLLKIKQPISFSERVELMQNYFLKADRKQHRNDHYVAMVHDAIGQYQATGWQLNTSAVAERLFLTSKTINRYFHRIVGISPKSYFSILRARTALSAYRANEDRFVAEEYGYYDLSHFHRNIVKFTGQKIKENRR